MKWSCSTFQSRLCQASRRAYSSISRDEGIASLSVVCGSSGSITIDLYNAKALSNPTGPLVIYLPSTGSHLKHHSRIPSSLFSTSAALARINYRWNIPGSSSTQTLSERLLSSDPRYDHHAFPIPLHDILSAYYHLTTEILPAFSNPQPLQYPSYSSRIIARKLQRPILVYGSNLGGSLATSLALTESFASRAPPSRIAGLITKNAIFDWTEIGTTEDSSLQDELSQPLSEEPVMESEEWNSTTLHQMKTRLFLQPSSTFDSFVSPVLFFHTPGIEIPRRWPGEEEPNATVVDMDPQSATYLQRIAVSPPKQPTTPPLDATATKGKYGGGLDEVTRRANLKFPPRDSGLRIPRSLFLHTSATKTNTNLPPNPHETKREAMRRMKEEMEVINPQHQAEEMCHLMRRSVEMHELHDRALWDENCRPEVVSGVRVRTLKVLDAEQENRAVREWIEDTLNSR